MASTTGIGWTDATVNFVIGCTMVGPGCGEIMPDGTQKGCYAAEWARTKFNITFGPGERRHVTQSGFSEPLKWQRMYDARRTTMRQHHAEVPLPRWVFACSLSDFFDNEWPEGTRERAWKVIRDCPALRWQIVTKRVGNVVDMLPADWDGGVNYPHVGIIATMVTQQEVARDFKKLANLRFHGVRWIGLSIEPQLEFINLGPDRLRYLSWVISGGESRQGDHDARPYDLEWGRSLRDECANANVPFFQKQFGDHPIQFEGRSKKFGAGGDDISKWPDDMRVQEMPRVYDNDPPYQPRNLPDGPALPLAPTNEPTLL